MNSSRCLQICAFMFVAVLLRANILFSAELEINDQHGTPGDRVTFTIILNNVDSDLNNMEFSVLYDEEILSLEDWEAGSLVSDFEFFKAAPIKGVEGVIKVAGITSNPITAGSTGDIVRIKFRVNQCGNAILELADLLGRIEGFSAGDGLFSCRADQP